MMVKVGNGYLELNDTIEVDKKVKLFEEFTTVQGDFSYSFSIPSIQNNESLIRFYSPLNSNKPWNFKIPAEVQDDSGITLYKGFIRGENYNYDSREYSASFFSGNTNWMEELDFNILDLDWSEFDKTSFRDFTATEGIVTPLTDRGGILSSRKSPLFDRSDFQPYFYVKDLIDKILLTRGFKLEGDLRTIPEYQKLATGTGINKYLQGEISKRESYAGKTGTQLFTSLFQKVTFTNVSAPFYNSELGNWDTTNSRYTFDIETKSFEIELNLIFNAGSYFSMRIRKNGSETIFTKEYDNVKKITDTLTASMLNENPSAGDYYEVQVGIQSSLWPDRTMVAGSSVLIRPVQFWKIFAGSVIPDIKANLLLSNVFRLFNCLVSYNANTKTITATTFDKILRSVPIDLSEFITVYEDNFEEFTSDYARQNLLVWGEQSNSELQEYNDTNDLPYGSGVIEIDNDFLDERDELMEMDFNAPYHKSYGFLGMDLPVTDFVRYTTKYTVDLNSVSNSGDLAQFNHDSYPPGGTFVGIVRISESTVEEYNGDYFALTINAFNGRVGYLGNASGRVEFLEASFVSSDPVFVLVEPNQEIGDISGVESFSAGSYASETTIAVAHFLSTVNFNSSLSFEDLIPKYFSGTEKMLNLGVKSYASGYLSATLYNEIDFTRTVKINESIYFINLIRGYKGSNFLVELELIKIG